MYGLVLEGGGAKGSYQVGAWKALRELGIEIGAVTGTSIGALNGAMIAQGAFEEVYDLWHNLKPSMAIKGNEIILEKLVNRDIDLKSVSTVLKCMKNVFSEGGLNIDPMRELVKAKIDEEKVRNSKIDFGLVTVSLTDRKSLEVFVDKIPQGRLHDYILASANLPVFKSEAIDGKKYIDGGFYDNLPIGLVASKGYKKIIAVKLHGLGFKKKIKRDDLEITYITPSESLGNTLEFKKETARRNIKMGYYDTMRIFKNLAGKRYYIDSSPNEEYIFHKLLGLSENTVLDIGEILGFENIPYRRMLFEKILPKVAALLGVDESEGYSTIILNLYEFVAERLEIDRYSIYKYNEFEELVTSKVKKHTSKGMPFENLPKLIKQTSLYRLTVKEELLTRLLMKMILSKNDEAIMRSSS